MTGFPEDHADRTDTAQMRYLLARMNQGRTSEQTLLVLETEDQTFIYAAESRAISQSAENPELEQEAGS
jgi:hypothetical protein